MKAYSYLKKAQLRQFIAFCLSTLFLFILLVGRWKFYPFDWTQIKTGHDLASYKGNATFLFLIWNMFLAWIPYWIAIFLDKAYDYSRSKWVAIGLLTVWLLFFPNAPYIITDLLHLRNRFPIPYWYDILLLFSFAWTGLMLGLASLYEVQCFLEKHLGKVWAWSSSVMCIGLAGFGVYIGRYLRWNSWDVIAQPKALSYELAQTIFSPAEGDAIGVTVVMNGFLLVAYLVFVAFAKRS